MEFKSPYLHAMREQAPQMFNQLRRAGQMDSHLQAKSEEAHELLRQLLAQRPKNKYGEVSLADEREAEEQVRATLIDFPAPEAPDQKEPPDDLPRMPSSPDRTTSSRPARSTKAADD